MHWNKHMLAQLMQPKSVEDESKCRMAQNRQGNRQESKRVNETEKEKEIGSRQCLKVHAVRVNSRYFIWIKIITTRELIMRTIVSVQFMIKTDMKEMRWLLSLSVMRCFLFLFPLFYVCSLAIFLHWELFGNICFILLGCAHLGRTEFSECARDDSLWRSIYLDEFKVSLKRIMNKWHEKRKETK